MPYAQRGRSKSYKSKVVQHSPNRRSQRTAAVALGLHLVVAAVCVLLPSGHAIASDGSDPPTLMLPYPLTGPREIQASDRITRRYRAVAAHAAPPITDMMADSVEAAVRMGLGRRLLRLRRDDARVFQNLGMDRSAPELLLAGDDLLRASDVDEVTRTGRLGELPALLDALATMPFVLLCAAPTCRANGATSSGPGIASAYRPRTLASAGEISTSHVAVQALTRHLRLGSLHVTYAGGNAVLGAVVAAQVDAGFVALPLALGYVRHEKARPLAISSEARFERLPELPTLRESGVPVVVEAWFALFSSMRMSASDAARIATAVRAHRLEPEVRSKWMARGLIPVIATAEAFGREVQAARSVHSRARR